MSIAGGGTALRANVQISTCNDENAQRFKLKATSGGYYNLINVGSGLCVDVSGASRASGAAIIQYNCGTGTNQQWLPQDTSNGYVRLTARHSGMVAAVAGAATADGTNLNQATWSSLTSQQFRLIPVADTSPVAACGQNQISMCTGANPIACHFGGSVGDYAVTVELGGAAAGDTIVEAETYRRMVGETLTTAGQTKRFLFVTNVRQPEGQPLQAGSDGIAGLDVYLRGSNPQLTAICQKPVVLPLKIWLAGDSTVCDQTSTDYSGWGQHLPQFFLSPVSVENLADSGESSGSFLASSKLWGAIKAGMRAGDWVMIQLGHNDKTTAAATFQSNLRTMVRDAKAAGAHPILVTPISRVGGTLAIQHVNGTGQEQHGRQQCPRGHERPCGSREGLRGHGKRARLHLVR